MRRGPCSSVTPIRQQAPKAGAHVQARPAQQARLKPGDVILAPGCPGSGCKRPTQTGQCHICADRWGHNALLATAPPLPPARACPLRRAAAVVGVHPVHAGSPILTAVPWTVVNVFFTVLASKPCGGRSRGPGQHQAARARPLPWRAHRLGVLLGCPLHPRPVTRPTSGCYSQINHFVQGAGHTGAHAHRSRGPVAKPSGPPYLGIACGPGTVQRGARPWAPYLTGTARVLGRLLSWDGAGQEQVGTPRASRAGPTSSTPQPGTNHCSAVTSTPVSY